MVINLPDWMWYKKGRGLALPFGLTFIKKSLKGWVRDYVIFHEECHHIQMKREGQIRFIFLYIFELVDNGYYNNKYEREAREYGRIKANKMRDACCGSN